MVVRLVLSINRQYTIPKVSVLYTYAYAYMYFIFP